MERCKICEEKAEVEICAHCEKRICSECKETHVEMLKRDLGRLLNQVKRISTRISEVASTLKRGLDSMATNSDAVKEEIQDYVRRYTKELQKREDTLLTEIETFTQAETRMMRELMENMSAESTNIENAMTKIDACLKGESPMPEDELVRYKQLFVEGLEYLKLFNFDSDEYAIKKIRFAVGPDPHILPHAIAQFGELHVCTTHFNKFQAPEMYTPKFSMGLESDNYPMKRRNFDLNDMSTWNRNEDTDRFPRRFLDPPDQPVSARRRFTPEEDVTRRLRALEPERIAPRDPTTVGSSSSPWARIHESRPEPAIEATTSAPRDPASSPNLIRKRDSYSDDEELNVRIASIRKDYESRRRMEPSVSPNPEAPSPPKPSTRERELKPYRQRTKTMPEQTARELSAERPLRDATSDDESESVPIPVLRYASPSRQEDPPIRSRDRSSRRYRTDDMAGRDSPEVKNPIDWKKYLIPNPSDAPAPRSSRADLELSTSSRRAPAITRDQRSSSREDSDPDWWERRRAFMRSQMNPEAPENTEQDSSQRQAGETSGTSTVRSKFLESKRVTDEKSTSQERPNKRSEETTSGTGTSSSSGQREKENESRPSRYKRKTERSHSAYVQQSDTAEEAEEPTPTPDVLPRSLRPSFPPPRVNYREKGSITPIVFGCKGTGRSQFNWPRGLAATPGSDDISVCDSSNHRVQVFSASGDFMRQFGAYGSGNADFDCLAGICINKYRQIVITDRYNHRVQIFDSSGKFLREFGSHGHTNGRLNSPWGVVVDNQGFIYVCDKDNNRIQIFQADGNFVGKFGGIGNREGQLQSPHFITCNKQNHLLVTDSSNHRVQAFDHNGHFLFTFGSEGFHEGHFKYPRGITTDEQGFILVADSGNNRVQVFYPDGRFYCAFGCWGTGVGQFKQVEGIALLSDGRVAVSDRENHRIQIF